MGNIFSISVSGDAIVNRCWGCVAGQAEFVCKLEENVEALKTAVAELSSRRNDVLRSVQLSEDQYHVKRLDQVQWWLSSAETLINEADLLIEKSPDEIKKLCIGGCCSKNPISNLKFGKQIAKKLRDVADHTSKGVFERVAGEVPRSAVTERPCEPTVGLESIFNKVWSFLEAEQVGIIGLYGMAGVGKTTLMNQINNKFSEPPKRFDAVIWMVVSKAFSIGKVQDEIAKQIGISITDQTWQDKTQHDKAADIFEVLKEKKFVVLLDDIWERVDLTDVGIPVPTKENSSKLVFTTRSVEVCGKMEAHKKIKVQCLSKEKAWELFQEKLGEECDPCIRELARELAEECGGLPLALVTVARAMACNKSVDEWKYAIKICKSSPPTSVFPDMDEKVYPLLKFSYDSLRSDMYRTCLLYCSLFSEDYQIEKDRLIDLWIGEGFLDERGQGNHIIGSLVRACLLDEINEFKIKMHDVIRDMCFSIASDCEKERFFVKAGCRLTMFSEVGNWGRSTHRMSLMGNRIENLVGSPNCPNIQTLFLNNNELKVINNDFFQFMCGLKVLDLSYNPGLEELPVGISKLVSLQCLDLSNTGIRQLPVELKDLKKLKCLNLQCFGTYIRIPGQLISALLNLQVLRMQGCYKSELGMVEELKCLNHLNVLTVTLRSASGLDRFWSAERLCSSTLHIDLQLVLHDSKSLNIVSLAKVKGLNSLNLRDCRSLEEVKPHSDHIQTSVIARQHCFQSLGYVYIRRCSELMDMTWLILAPNLRKLNVFRCEKMEEIINERKLRQVAEQVETSRLFAKLESFGLQYLSGLKSIYWDTLPLSCLEQIYVVRCPKLKKLPLNSNSTAKENKISIRGEKEWWKELQWDDESTRNQFLPCFKPL